MRDTEPYKTGYDEGFAKGFIKAVELANAVASDGEQRLLLAMESFNYLPFPKIIKLFSLSVNQAEKIVEQADLDEYVKDKFDLYMENDGFFNQESMERIYHYRLKSAKRDIEDTPAHEIIRGSKILVKDLKRMLIEYIEEQEKAGSKDRGKGERE